MRIERQTLAICACFLAALVLTWWAYAPGLHGDFLFDDLANMPALGSSGPVTRWSTFFRYITSGTADATGRPLTLLSFLIDGHDWPTPAYPFKRTNLVLHLVNGVLLALLLVQLGSRLVEVESRHQQLRVRLAAITTATIWLLHPLLVSTVLYVVQREAMLPMPFVLIGLLLWLHGRDALMQGDRLRGCSCIFAGLFLCSVLAVLCKPNGALLPLYALLIEYLLLPRSSSPEPTATVTADVRTYHHLFAWLAWLPSLLVLAYLAYAGISGSIHGVGRPWSIGQRLLTEPRVLFDYLDLLWLPHPFTTGLFNDQWMASTSLWSPPSTVLAMAGLLGLIVLGWRLRHLHPPLSLAILFFFSAQLIESSTIPLELYYEHRNYIAAMLMFWPLSLWLWGAGRSEASHYSRAKMAFLLALVLCLTGMTHARAQVWGNNQEQALLWAKLNPGSARAQANAANHEMAMGRPQAAAIRLTGVLHEHPYDPQITLNILSAHCAMDGLTGDDLNLAESTLSRLNTGESVIFHWLGNAIEDSATHACPGLDNQFIESMLDAAQRNPQLQKVTGRMQDIYHLRGELALSNHKAAEALTWFNRGLTLRPGQQMAFEQAALLGSKGYPVEGLQHLQYFETFEQAGSTTTFGMPRVHEWVLQKQNYWGKELIHLRATLQADAAQFEASRQSQHP